MGCATRNCYNTALEDLLKWLKDRLPYINLKYLLDLEKCRNNRARGLALSNFNGYNIYMASEMFKIIKLKEDSGERFDLKDAKPTEKMLTDITDSYAKLVCEGYGSELYAIDKKYNGLKSNGLLFPKDLTTAEKNAILKYLLDNNLFIESNPGLNEAFRRKMIITLADPTYRNGRSLNLSAIGKEYANLLNSNARLAKYIEDLLKYGSNRFLSIIPILKALLDQQEKELMKKVLGLLNNFFDINRNPDFFRKLLDWLKNALMKDIKALFDQMMKNYLDPKNFDIRKYLDDTNVLKWLNDRLINALTPEQLSKFIKMLDAIGRDNLSNLIDKAILNKFNEIKNSLIEDILAKLKADLKDTIKDILNQLLNDPDFVKALFDSIKGLLEDWLKNKLGVDDLAWLLDKLKSLQDELLRLYNELNNLKNSFGNIDWDKLRRFLNSEGLEKLSQLSPDELNRLISLLQKLTPEMMDRLMKLLSNPAGIDALLKLLENLSPDDINSLINLIKNLSPEDVARLRDLLDLLDDENFNKLKSLLELSPDKLKKIIDLLNDPEIDAFLSFIKNLSPEDLKNLINNFALLKDFTLAMIEVLKDLATLLADNPDGFKRLSDIIAGNPQSLLDALMQMIRNLDPDDLAKLLEALLEKIPPENLKAILDILDGIRGDDVNTIADLLSKLNPQELEKLLAFFNANRSNLDDLNPDELAELYRKGQISLDDLNPKEETNDNPFDSSNDALFSKQGNPLENIPTDVLMNFTFTKRDYVCFEPEFNANMYLTVKGKMNIMTQSRMRNLERLHNEILLPIYNYYFGPNSDYSSCSMKIYTGLADLEWLDFRPQGTGLSKHLNGMAVDFYLIGVDSLTIVRDIKEGKIPVKFGVMYRHDGVHITLPYTFEGYEVSGVIIESNVHAYNYPITILN